MCGIAGFVEDRPRGEALERTAALIAQMAHRGPDGHGVAGVRRVAIGAARLAVRGSDVMAIPLVDEKRGLALAYNGEIYERSVPAAGSDTRWLLDRAGEGRGWPAPDGMYAYAVADLRAERVTLRRDPLGIKPLYLGHRATASAFASELGPVARALALPVSLDPAAVLEYAGLGCRLDDRTPFAGAVRVGAGAEAVLEPGRAPRVRAGVSRPPAAYSNGPATGPRPGDLADLLAEAVRACARVAGPVGVLLSGGVDSTTLAAVLAADGREDVHTFSLLLDHDGVRDLAGLGLPGRAWKAWRHTAVTVGRGRFWRAFARMSELTSEPVFSAGTAYAAILAEEAAQAGVSVVLSGEGIDECFGGYPSYAALAAADGPAGDGAAGFYLDRGAFPVASKLVGPAACETVSERVRALVDGPGTPYARVLRAERILSLGPLLGRLDLAAMAHSIEARTPFLHGGIPGLAEEWTPALRPHPGDKPLFREAAARLGTPEPERPKRPLRATLATVLGPTERAGLARTLSGDVVERLPVDRGTVAALVGALPGAGEATLLVALRLVQLVRYCQRHEP